MAAVAQAQPGTPEPVAPGAPHVAIPNFWPPRARLKKPDLASIRVIRFLTDDEYPPLHFAGYDGNPAGFSVDLARAVCDKLHVPCTIQVRRFDTLEQALADKRGDAIAAAIPITARLRRQFAVTRPYYRTPARFAVRKAAELPQPSAAALAGRKVGVVGDTTHAVFLSAFFPQARQTAFPDLARAEDALKDGRIDYLFADGPTLALWLDGTSASGCCAFTGGPYLSPRYFGEGVGFIVRKDDETLRRALDYALQEVWQDGTYTDLYLRYFPVSFY